MQLGVSLVIGVFHRIVFISHLVTMDRSHLRLFLSHLIGYVIIHNHFLGVISVFYK